MVEARHKISVIICGHSMERLADILEAVDSALSQTLPPHQVIVSVDNNRELSDRLKSDLPASVLLVLNDGIKGLSETRNTGIRAATGEIIAFMDDDAVAEKDWLEKLAQPFEADSVAAAGGKITPRWLNGGRPTWFPEELDWIIGCTYLGLPRNGNRVRNLIGCNMAFRARVFDRVGFFNPAVGRTSKVQGIGEDSEFCLRLTRNLPGAFIIYEPSAVVHHKVPSWRTELSYLLKRSYDEGYHKSIVGRLHPGRDVNSLSTESSYLRYLLFHAVTKRLRRIYRQKELLQLDVILTCIAATGAGYVRGRMKATMGL